MLEIDILFSTVYSSYASEVNNILQAIVLIAPNYYQFMYDYCSTTMTRRQLMGNVDETITTF